MVIYKQQWQLGLLGKVLPFYLSELCLESLLIPILPATGTHKTCLKLTVHQSLMIVMRPPVVLSETSKKMFFMVFFFSKKVHTTLVKSCSSNVFSRMFTQNWWDRVTSQSSKPSRIRSRVVSISVAFFFFCWCCCCCARSTHIKGTLKTDIELTLMK